MATSPSDLTVALQTVKQAAGAINATGSGSEKNSELLRAAVPALRIKALAAMSDTIAKHQDDILEANTLDLEISRDMAVPDLVVEWLKLTPERVQKVANIFQRLSLTGPVCTVGQTGGHSTSSAQYRLCPVGTVGFIYEAFPDLGAIAAALCICTGNALVLRGGGEASRTNQIITQLLKESLASVGLPADLIYLANSTEVSRQDVAQCTEIDLIISHGRPSLVEQVIKQASVPVIPSRMGNCYLYWSGSGSLDKVYQMTVDSHSGTPDAVNRIEKILVHEAHSPNSVIRLWNRLQESGFEVVADEAITALLSSDALRSAQVVPHAEWNRAYLKKKVALRQVSSGDTAIAWINTYSSGHADSIVTADYTESQQFIKRCRSAAVYINVSPQFLRDATQVEAIAIGASDYKGTAGGLIGMDAIQVRQRVLHGG